MHLWCKHRRATKGKRVVLEFDGLTGEVHSGGKKQSNQIKGMLTADH